MPSDFPLEDGAPKQPLRAQTMVGAALALAVSGGLVAWLVSADHEPSVAALSPPVAQRPAPVHATAQADAGQVRQAYDDFQSHYADGGPEGLSRLTSDCFATLKADPRILDDCLALDLFAAAIIPERASAEAETERLALTSAALAPGGSAPDRIAEVRALIRKVSLGDRPPAAESLPAPEPLPRTEPLPRAAPPHLRRIVLVHPSRPVRAAKPKGPTTPQYPRLADTCRSAPTEADRLICAQPSLGAAHDRMRRAYDEALAVGVDRDRVDRDQASWRDARDAAQDAGALAALYDRRTRELQDLSPPH